MIAETSTSTAVASASSAVVAAVLTAWLALRAKRVEATSPTSVAGGYTQLVADQQTVIDRMAAELVALRVEVIALRTEVGNLRVVESEMRAENAVLRGKVQTLEAAVNRAPTLRTRQDD